MTIFLTRILQTSNVQTVLDNVQEAIEKPFQWFSPNYLVANADKCHLASSETAVDTHISDPMISYEKKRVKLLEITLDFDVRLNFDFHVDTLTKEVSKKFPGLKRVSNHMDSNKRRALVNAFIKSQFSYCPLVWIVVP